MWSLTQLREFLDSQEFAQQNETAAEFKKTNSQNDEDLWTSKLLPQIKEIIVNAMLTGWGFIDWRPGGVGIFGFDIMSDANLKLWMIEVNKTP
jgi:D-alanine-D-alanine ligase-like ATP-grasp enzyme